MLVQQQAPTRWSSTDQQAKQSSSPSIVFTHHTTTSWTTPPAFAWIMMAHSSIGLKMYDVIRYVGIGYSSQDCSTPIVPYLSPHPVSQANHQPKKKTNLQANHQPKKMTILKRNSFKEKKSTASQTHHINITSQTIPPLQLCQEWSRYHREELTSLPRPFEQRYLLLIHLGGTSTKWSELLDNIISPSFFQDNKHLIQVFIRIFHMTSFWSISAAFHLAIPSSLQLCAV